jgi:hypothetical protein
MQRTAQSRRAPTRGGLRAQVRNPSLVAEDDGDLLEALAARRTATAAAAPHSSGARGGESVPCQAGRESEPPSILDERRSPCSRSLAGP